MTSSASGQPINAKATYEPRRSENPRRVRNGIRLRTRDGVVARHWIAERWLRLIAGSPPTR